MLSKSFRVFRKSSFAYPFARSVENLNKGLFHKDDISLKDVQEFFPKYLTTLQMNPSQINEEMSTFSSEVDSKNFSLNSQTTSSDREEYTKKQLLILNKASKGFLLYLLSLGKETSHYERLANNERTMIRLAARDENTDFFACLSLLTAVLGASFWEVNSRQGRSRPYAQQGNAFMKWLTNFFIETNIGLLVEEQLAKAMSDKTLTAPVLKIMSNFITIYLNHLFLDMSIQTKNLTPAEVQNILEMVYNLLTIYHECKLYTEANIKANYVKIARVADLSLNWSEKVLGEHHELSNKLRTYSKPQLTNSF
jgi:hypothetical protein